MNAAGKFLIAAVVALEMVSNHAIVLKTYMKTYTQDADDTAQEYSKLSIFVKDGNLIKNKASINSFIHSAR